VIDVVVIHSRDVMQHWRAVAAVKHDGVVFPVIAMSFVIYLAGFLVDLTANRKYAFGRSSGGEEVNWIIMVGREYEQLLVDVIAKLRWQF